MRVSFISFYSKFFLSSRRRRYYYRFRRRTSFRRSCASLLPLDICFYKRSKAYYLSLDSDLAIFAYYDCPLSYFASNCISLPTFSPTSSKIFLTITYVSWLNFFSWSPTNLDNLSCSYLRLAINSGTFLILPLILIYFLYLLVKS